MFAPKPSQQFPDGMHHSNCPGPGIPTCRALRCPIASRRTYTARSGPSRFSQAMDQTFWIDNCTLNTAIAIARRAPAEQIPNFLRCGTTWGLRLRAGKNHQSPNLRYGRRDLARAFPYRLCLRSAGPAGNAHGRGGMGRTGHGREGRDAPVHRIHVHTGAGTATARDVVRPPTGPQPGRRQTAATLSPALPSPASTLRVR